MTDPSTLPARERKDTSLILAEHRKRNLKMTEWGKRPFNWKAL
jgi:hypothetical protein